jgi:hypothetical protein
LHSFDHLPELFGVCPRCHRAHTAR